MPGEYIKLVNGMFAVQKSGEALIRHRLPDSHTQTIFEDLQKEHPAPKVVVRKSLWFSLISYTITLQRFPYLLGYIIVTTFEHTPTERNKMNPTIKKALEAG